MSYNTVQNLYKMIKIEIKNKLMMKMLLCYYLTKHCTAYILRQLCTIEISLGVFTAAARSVLVVIMSKCPSVLLSFLLSCHIF